jgi:hypothetical protein
VSLWHTLRRECTGAWRSVRYDLATHRAAKLAGAFTEEFAPSTPPVPTPSRFVPLTGVALLLAGGAAGALVAINGGLAAVTADDQPAPSPPAAAAQDPTYGSGATVPGTPPSHPPARRPGVNRTPEPGPVPAPVISIPITEGNVLPTVPSVEASSASSAPAPSTSESEPGDDATHTEAPRSRSPRSRR